MAADKNSFVLYKDIIHTVRKMPKEKVAELFLHILAYVNDEDPVTDDVIIELTFEPIKQSLKRDLKKYEKVIERNRNNGKLGGRPTKEPKKPTGLNRNPKNPTEPKKADSVSDSVSDINNSLMSEIKISDVRLDLVEYFNIAERFRTLFIKNLKEKNAPTAHQDKAKFKNYVDPIRLMLTNKECTVDDLRDVWMYLEGPTGEFWKKTILSTEKLRKHIAGLIMDARKFVAEKPKKDDRL